MIIYITATNPASKFTQSMITEIILLWNASLYIFKITNITKWKHFVGFNLIISKCFYSISIGKIKSKTLQMFYLNKEELLKLNDIFKTNKEHKEADYVGTRYISYKNRWNCFRHFNRRSVYKWNWQNNIKRYTKSTEVYRMLIKVFQQQSEVLII